MTDDGRNQVSEQAASTQQDDLKRLRAQMREARDDLFTLASILNEADEHTDYEARRLRATLKGLGRLREQGDIDNLRHGIASYEHHQEEYEEKIIQRLGREALPGHEASSSSAAEGESVEPEDVDESKTSQDEEVTEQEPHSSRVYFVDRSSASSSVNPLDLLTDAQIEEHCRRHLMVADMKLNGLSGQKAVEEYGFDRSARWARDLLQKYEKEGPSALYDNRWFPSRKSSVLTREVRDLILAFSAKYPAAGPTLITKKVARECEKRDLKPPSRSTVQRYLDSLTLIESAFLTGDDDQWKQNHRPVTRVELATHGNERFQMDHSPLDIWVRMQDDGEWMVSTPWITVVLDVYSRTIAGFFLSNAYPDADAIALAFRHAVLPKEREGWSNRGLPDVVQHDRGPDFMSHTVTASFASLGVVVDPTPPNYPNANGKVERVFQTLDTGLLRGLPGHKETGRSEGSGKKRIDKLITREHLQEEIERFIVHDYHQRVHSTTNEKPADRWRRSFRLRLPEDEASLDSFLIRTDKTRTIQNEGIRFTVDGTGGRYWCPAIAYHDGQAVTIGYHPDLMESINVHLASTGEFVGEAHLMGHPDCPYDAGDVKRVRAQLQKGMKERVAELIEGIEAEDRRKARTREAQELEKQMAEADASEEDAPDAVDEEAERLAEMMRQADRRSA